MTEPTYYARFANEAERELARRITSLHVDDDYPWDAIFFNGPIRMAWRKDIGSDWVEIPFPEFIRRFVPLSVIGALAECHGMYVVDNESIEIIEQSGYTGNKHLNAMTPSEQITALCDELQIEKPMGTFTGWDTPPSYKVFDLLKWKGWGHGYAYGVAFELPDYYAWYAPPVDIHRQAHCHSDDPDTALQLLAVKRLQEIKRERE